MGFVNSELCQNVSNDFLMKKFTIKDIERFSDIKAHTLRIWERRYAIQQPGRTETNFRHYNLQQVKDLLSIALFNKNGYKISYLSTLSADEINCKLQQLTKDDERQQAAIIDLIIHMYSMNAVGFENRLDESIEHWGYDAVVRNIIFPFLNKTEILWRGRRLDEEHFVVTAIRKKIIGAIESLRNNNNSTKTVLLFLPDQQQLDLALLYTNYLLKAEGVKVLYMGNDISMANLKAYIESCSPQYLFTYLSQKNNFQLAQASALLQEKLPQSKLVITTYPDVEPYTGKYQNITVMPYDEAIKMFTS